MTAELRSTSQGLTMVLTISNPEHRNALGPEMYAAGVEALSVAESSPEVRSVVIVGDGALAMRLSDRLFESGVFAQGIAFPTVPRGKARVRTIVAATHTEGELQYALDTFAKVGRELGVIP